MLVKTFQAEEMSEALRMVKAEMGLDAMILSSRKERRKGILGYFSKPYFEVTAAIEPVPAAGRPDPFPEPERPAQVPERSTREEFENSMLGPLARELRELKLRVEELSRKDAEQQAAALRPEPPADPEQAPRTFAKEEVEEIKKLLYSAVSKEKQVARRVTFPLADPSQATAEPLQEREPAMAEAAAPESPDSGTSVVLELLEKELRAEELGAAQVELLLDEVRAAAEEGAGIEALRGLLAGNLARLVKCSGALRMKKNGSRVIAVVGPTGVGKTTTIAKLAALYALERGVKVALVTTDNFRVGAVEQLATYAKIMDLPLEVVANAQELSAALAKHGDKDLVLIDTAGRSPKDAERLDELKGFLESHPGIETHLCVCATTRARELDDTVASFAKLPLAKLLFTKLDESESFGSIVEVHLKHRLPVSYLTTGQKVPEDIEVATGKKLASLVVRGPAR
jgi:flagellar biosynthesis protein FlhF